MRNDSFIGFTSTPIEADDVNTPAVFGHYTDVCRAAEDGDTVPIYYESRLTRLALIADEKEDEEESVRERTKQKWTSVESLVEEGECLRIVAQDIESRAALEGKGMIVCMRYICVKLYDELAKLHPAWHSDDDTQGTNRGYFTGSGTEEPGHIHPLRRVSRRNRADEAKEPGPRILAPAHRRWHPGAQQGERR